MEQTDLLEFLVETKSILESYEVQKAHPTFFEKLSFLINFFQSKLKLPKPLANKSKLGPCEIKDFYVLEYSLAKDKYQIIGNDCAPELKNDRQTILNLLISLQCKNHKEAKQKTKSMTQLHKLTSNPPCHAEAIVLPNFLSEKYIYIYETKECAMKSGKYYLIERYYCFMANQLCLKSIDELFKRIKLKSFENRLMYMETSQNVEWKLVTECFRKQFITLNELSFSSKLFKNSSNMHPYVNSLVSFQNQNQANSLIPLIVFLFLFIIKQGKIIFLSHQNHKSIITKIILSVSALFYPLQYVYPIVYAYAFTHLQFIQSPIPIIIHYWANDKLIQKFKNDCQKILQKQKDSMIPSVLIDTQQMRILYCTELEYQDNFILEKIMREVHQGVGENSGEKLLNFYRQNILQKKKKQDQLGQWVELIRKYLQNTQMWEIWKSQSY